ncbi:NUDIX domain-containing protein [Candidatus Woesebacteria bacterium]|nr:NUDIX domain-containing protein [Candidatus Woesebacteria bacterium]
MELPIKVEGIIFARENSNFKFLIIKRVPEDGGFWQPLTESLEEGETIEECLRRGLKEELGIRSIKSVTDRIWSFPWENKHGEPNIDLVYAVELSGSEKITLNLDEHSEYKWCLFEEALDLLGKENNKKAFERFKEKIMKS